MTSPRALLIAAALLFSPGLAQMPAPAANPAAANLTGTYTGTSQARGVLLGFITVYGPERLNLKVNLKDEAGVLSGTVETSLAGGAPATSPVKGRVSGDKVTILLGVKLCDGTPAEVALNGRMNDRGQIEVGRASQGLTCSGISGEVVLEPFSLSR